MSLISLREVHWGFGGIPLLEGIDMQIQRGERICLVGRNGAGKSSLLKLVGRRFAPDSGEILHRKGLTIGVMGQEVPRDIAGTVFDVVAQGVAESRYAYNAAAATTASSRSDKGAGKVGSDPVQGGPAKDVETILSRTGLDPEAVFADLSAGMKRRTFFARALVSDPDIVLLDEPTNHLDIQAIEWMEAFIQRHVKSLLFVTHDRSFLKRIATRIVELDRGRLASYACDYDTYLSRRENFLEAEARQHQEMDKKLAREEVWIRQGIKARRTRNQGRVRALQRLRVEVGRRRSRVGQAHIRVQDAESTGRMVIQARDVTLAYGKRSLVHGFSTTIMRGDKVGLIGPNGVGKTTLLKLLVQQIPPDSGSVTLGTRLQIAYYDQLRILLDDALTVAENISAENDFIRFNDQNRHVIGYLQDFLFTPQRCRTPVRILSGGERNRLMLAKLFTLPANVLVLDEPTNDLDTDTLELLEELLHDYSGTVLIVSHDRDFLNNVVTSTLVFEGQGRVVAYAGGYDDWLAQRPLLETVSDTTIKPRPVKPSVAQPSKAKKLGYMQARELADLPRQIETLEAEQRQIHDTMAAPDYYKRPKEKLAALQTRLKEIEAAVSAAYDRWQELESLGGGAG